MFQPSDFSHRPVKHLQRFGLCFIVNLTDDGGGERLALEVETDDRILCGQSLQHDGIRKHGLARTMIAADGQHVLIAFFSTPFDRKAVNIIT